MIRFTPESPILSNLQFCRPLKVESVVPNFVFNKSVPYGFEPNCSALATQKLEDKVQQHDDEESNKKIGDSCPILDF